MDQFIEIFQKLKPWQRYLAVGGVCALFMVLFFYLMVLDLWTEIGQKEKSISDVNREIDNQIRISKDKPRLEAEIAKAKVELEKVVLSLPEKQDIEDLLKTITNLLTEYSLVSSKFVPGKEAPDSDIQYMTIPIAISVRGDYKKLYAFFSQLKVLQRIVNVPTVSFKPAAGLSPEEAELSKKLGIFPVDAEITGRTYRRLSPEEVAALSKKQPAKKR